MTELPQRDRQPVTLNFITLANLVPDLLRPHAILSLLVNLALRITSYPYPCMPLDCGWKLEYWDRTYYLWFMKTCVHTERPQSARGFTPRTILMWIRSAVQRETSTFIFHSASVHTGGWVHTLEVLMKNYSLSVWTLPEGLSKSCFLFEWTWGDLTSNSYSRSAELKTSVCGSCSLTHIFHFFFYICCLSLCWSFQLHICYQSLMSGS